MRVFRRGAELHQACEQARQVGHVVGFVPTMGALHAGHLALVDSLPSNGSGFRVVSIFVNPLQFGAGEDLDKYPRTLETDLGLCERHGVDAVFVPSVKELYPHGFQTGVRVNGITEVLEGEKRPGHFDGVTTVVAKLFNLVGDCRAVFGRKDYQQLAVIRRMVRDLGFPVRVEGHSIVRERDGLALSSRNRYLSESARKRACSLNEAIRVVRGSWRCGERDARSLEEEARAIIAGTVDRIDYIALRDPESLESVERFGQDSAAVMLVAAVVEGTRLIDNSVLSDADFLLPES